MLAKIGSTRVAIPAGVSLEHIRKPSIRPSPDSDSIYCPEETEPLAGGARIDSGASEPVQPAGAKRKTGSGSTSPNAKRQRGDDSPHPGATSPHPGAASPHPGATSSDPGAGSAPLPPPPPTGSDPHLEPVRQEIAAMVHSILAVKETPYWAQPILDYLVSGVLPQDEVEARQIQRRSKSFAIGSPMKASTRSSSTGYAAAPSSSPVPKRTTGASRQPTKPPTSSCPPPT